MLGVNTHSGHSAHLEVLGWGKQTERRSSDQGTAGTVLPRWPRVTLGQPGVDGASPPPLYPPRPAVPRRWEICMRRQEPRDLQLLPAPAPQRNAHRLGPFAGRSETGSVLLCGHLLSHRISVLPLSRDGRARQLHVGSRRAEQAGPGQARPPHCLQRSVRVLGRIRPSPAWRAIAGRLPGMAANWAAWAFLGMGVFWLTVSPEERRPEAGGSRTCPWECLIFVQLWPGSFCVALGRQFECVVPKNAHNWTIHGLWPDHVTECCAFWRLFPSDLAGLESELSLQWPTFINTSSFSFWEKEWQKHGTCAGCIETLHTPQNYFQAALFLHSKYNIDRAFQTAAVVPSCSRNYQFQTFTGALEPFLGNQYELQCVTDAQGRQILVQIKISLYSNFSTGCMSGSSGNVSPYKPCRAEKGIFYFPTNQEDPRNPCP
ncbi:uncharacterized protein LOC123026169 isoform X2 [Varanus komodoensis]|uniref:uncharacterized protein LOC123026169 isoform X2 n=1 Tax=Varanus komodoensis TaxID=61221 RepID=UPI001CF7AF1A|nr:uncharacterized protein LOC123026169 isoform X2 [Varanus komodoensis]